MPYMKNGVPLRVQVLVPISFSLVDEPKTQPPAAPGGP